MMAEAKTHNVQEGLINGYLQDMDEILQNLEDAKNSLETDFTKEGEAYFPEVGKYIYSAYGLEEKLALIETIKTALGKYRNWVDATMQECFNEDDQKAANTGSDNISGADQSGAGSSGGSSGTPMSKLTTPKASKKTTPGASPSTVPKLTTPIATPSTTAPGGGGDTPSITPPSSPSVLPTAAPTAAPTVSPSGGGQGGGIVSPTVSATVSPTASAMGADGKNGKGGLGSSLKGILEAGTQLKGNLNDGLSNLTGRLGSGNGGILSAGTAAGLALAAGGAAVTTGILLKNKSKSYTFKPEDFEALPEETQQEILSQFKSVNASEEEMDLFRTSTFMIAASVFDEHIKKAEQSYEKDQNTAQLISNSYGFDIYSEEGKVDKYLLFVAMLIDGCSETNEKNIYNTFNLALDEEDIDFIYSGLNMFDYIVKEQEEEDTSQYEEYEEIDGGGFRDNKAEEDSSNQTTGVEAWLQDMGALD